MSFAYLHTRSYHSLLAGGSSPAALAAQAIHLGMDALALTDVQGMRGAVRFATACQAAGLKPIYGAELPVAGSYLVLLCANKDGYGELCRLLTASYAHTLTLEDLHDTQNLFCLTGGREGLLAQALCGTTTARSILDRLKAIFQDRLSVELWHHLHEEDAACLRALRQIAASCRVACAIGGDVRFARPEDYARYDLLTCVRLGRTVFEHDPARPANAEAFLRAPAALRRLLPYPRAFDRAAEIAAACHVDLLPGHLIPPAPMLENAEAAPPLLRHLCEVGLAHRYRDSPHKAAAQKQMAHELDTITALELDDFFLVVHEIIAEARRRGIRYAGRGSAANSIVAYLLGITTVCPIAQNLLFERFLHRGRQGTPDIDVDFDSDRREEVIAWVESRFGSEHTAMTATVVQYGLRLAIRDVAKALGWPAPSLSQLSKAVPRRRSTKHIQEFKADLVASIGDSPMLDALLKAVVSLDGVPRHLGLHNGGMILSRTPLWAFTPTQHSANGVRMVQFDKDDVEALGLVKFDMLGLRMLAAIDMASRLVATHERGEALPESTWIDELPLDDEATFASIRRGDNLGVFQIESMGQMHLVASHQPTCFQDLVTQVAIFRPGPLQAGMVHPFIRRRLGQEPVTYDHALLEPILKDTCGVVLFQEQILEIAHQFAGMTLEESDGFRRLMSKFRDPGELTAMKERFIDGALRNGVSPMVAEKVFGTVSGYVGYGFCRSHAAAFARTVYQSAYLKTHHAAAYFAGLLEHHPGMFDVLTLEQEARRLGVRMLRACIQRSEARYTLERDERGTLCIRRPLRVVAGIAPDDGAEIVWARLTDGLFQSVEDLYSRVALDNDQFHALAASGALDEVAGDRRRALWEVGVLSHRHGTPGQQAPANLLGTHSFSEGDVPLLPPLTAAERLSWNLQTTSTSNVHPVASARTELNALCVKTVAALQKQKRGLARVAGRVIMRQRPPTAKGVVFITLEDETGIVQAIVYPKRAEKMRHALRAPAVVLAGQVQSQGQWRALIVSKVWPLPDVLGGYSGHLQMGGGRDRFVSHETPQRDHTGALRRQPTARVSAAAA